MKINYRKNLKIHLTIFSLKINANTKNADVHNTTYPFFKILLNKLFLTLFFKYILGIDISLIYLTKVEN